MAWEFVRNHLALMGELSEILVALGLIVFVSGVLIARFDKVSLEDALYLAFITAFTVGFGDVTPKSRAAKILTVFLAFIGLLMAGVVVAVAAQALAITLDSTGL